MIALSATLTVVLRQQDNTEGRLNNSRTEQTVGLWLPTDLASSDTTPNLTAGASPCAPNCPANVNVGGSNALLLSWTIKGATTATDTTAKVSYRYINVGYEWQLVRISCVTIGTANPTCTQNVVIHDLDPPPDDVIWSAGVTVPSWVLQVSVPLAPDDPGNTGTTVAPDPTAQTKNAQRVVVYIDGGGDGVGAGGGTNEISYSAGGTERSDLLPGSTVGTPSFTQARSRCGGNIAIIVDDSGSIGTHISDVKAAVDTFITKFAGTPVKLKVVRFDSTSSVVGQTVDGAGKPAGTYPNGKYFDMLNNTDVSTVRTAIQGLTDSGGTNYEDAFSRLFYNTNGTVQTVVPDMVVFFTDGIPTYSRVDYASVPSSSFPTTPPARLAGGFTANGSDFNYESWWRANEIVRTFRSSVRFIGVGVGPAIDGVPDSQGKPDESAWVTAVNGYYMNYASNVHYYRSYHWKTRSGTTGSYTTVVTKATWDSTATNKRSPVPIYENPVPSATRDYWERISYSSYLLISSSQRKSVYEAPDGSFDNTSSISASTYNSNNSSSDNSDGYWFTKVYATPYTNYDLVTVATPNTTILTRLVAGNDFGVPALFANNTYTNPEQANMYLLPQWDQFEKALEAVALAECGGTLTLQTKVSTGPAQDPFQYQNTKLVDAGGGQTLGTNVVTTSSTYTSGTFDFTISNGQYVDVTIEPQNLSVLTGYSPAGWTCRAGAQTRTFTPVSISNSSWTGITVRVAANEAVSCVQNVTKLTP